ncbi:hypothetical protein ES705_32444 [subsurface metagenome]
MTDIPETQDQEEEETQDPEEEESQDPEEQEQEEEAPEAENPQPEDAQPRQPADEKKIVIILKADTIMLGVQAPDCDPVYTTAKGDLEVALQMVPGLVAEAVQKWVENPQYPKAVMPEPPQPPVSQRTPASTRPAAPAPQPSFF